FEETIFGVKFWPFIRFDLYRYMDTQINNLGSMHSQDTDLSFKHRFINKCTQAIDYIGKSPKWNLKEKDILIFNHSRRVKQGDYYECIFTDQLIQELPYSYYVM